MRVEPGGRELLRVARAELLESLLPHIPESHRYAARMVANAMAVAMRELEAPAAVETDVPALARDIRSGAHDAPEASARLLHELRALTRARLAISNPRVLEGSAR
jgi:hypothetical protein